MHHEHQHTLTGHHRVAVHRRLPGHRREQCGPQRDVGRQVENVHGRADDSGFQLVGRGGNHGQVDARLVRGKDLLIRLPVQLREPRAQTLVPDQDIVQRGPERHDVQPSGHPQHQRDVVDRGRAFQLVQEPHLTLRIRRRDHKNSLRAGASDEGRRTTVTGLQAVVIPTAARDPGADQTVRPLQRVRCSKDAPVHAIGRSHSYGSPPRFPCRSVSRVRHGRRSCPLSRRARGRVLSRKPGARCGMPRRCPAGVRPGGGATVTAVVTDVFGRGSPNDDPWKIGYGAPDRLSHHSQLSSKVDGPGRLLDISRLACAERLMTPYFEKYPPQYGSDA